MPVPTRRLAALFVISAIVLALSASGQPETWFVVLSILVGVAIVDLAMAVRPRTIEVRRESPRSSPWNTGHHQMVAAQPDTATAVVVFADELAPSLGAQRAGSVCDCLALHRNCRSRSATDTPR
jgi:hypothetical protein